MTNLFLRLDPSTLILSKAPSFGESPHMSAVDRVAARVMAIAPDGRVLFSGSSVRIGVGIYLTARHVLEDFLQDLGATGSHMNFSIFFVHLYEGETVEIWSATNSWFGTNTDIAVLRAIPYFSSVPHLMAVNTVGINLGPPANGSRIAAYGYRKSGGTFRVDSNGFHLDIWGEPTTAIGAIREIHLQQCDSVMRNFPCFRVNTKFAAGMSGGPVFSDDGNLCGVICSGYELEPDAEEEISYASTLWPALCIPITVDMGSGIDCQPYCLIELARRGTIHVQHPEWLEANITEDGFNGVYRPI